MTYGSQSSPTGDLYLRLDMSGGAPPEFFEARVHIYNQYPNSFPAVGGSDYVAFGWNPATLITPIVVSLSGPRGESGTISFTASPPSGGNFSWVKMTCIP